MRRRLQSVSSERAPEQDVSAAREIGDELSHQARSSVLDEQSLDATLISNMKPQYALLQCRDLLAWRRWDTARSWIMSHRTPA